MGATATSRDAVSRRYWPPACHQVLYMHHDSAVHTLGAPASVLVILRVTHTCVHTHHRHASYTLGAGAPGVAATTAWLLSGPVPYCSVLTLYALNAMYAMCRLPTSRDSPPLRPRQGPGDKASLPLTLLHLQHSYTCRTCRTLTLADTLPGVVHSPLRWHLGAQGGDQVHVYTGHCKRAYRPRVCQGGGPSQRGSTRAWSIPDLGCGYSRPGPAASHREDMTSTLATSVKRPLRLVPL